MSGKWLWQESKDEWHSSGIGATPGKSQTNTKRKKNHLLIEQCISLYWAMGSLSLYIIKQCLLRTNIAMPVASYVSIATIATFFVPNLHWRWRYFPLQPQHTSSITDSRAGARSVQLISSASPLTHHPWPSGPWFRILASNACFQT